MSVSRIPSTWRANKSAVRIRLVCKCTAALGLPVEPEEYSQKQASSGCVGAAVAELEARSITVGRCAKSPPGALPDTIMRPCQSAIRAASSREGNNDSELTTALARLSYKT